ncbi:MAG TPA: alpha/beta fold hydrolase [Actinocrinis sp.]
MTINPAEALQPGAEPFESPVPGNGAADRPEARVGVLLCHGFTGSPQSMRPWAEHLTAAGFRVSLPRLPGHGLADWRPMQDTTWQDWYAEVGKAFARLLESCDEVFVTGLSMGGALALRLAEQHGPDVRGLVLVNPSVKRNAPREALIPVAARVLPSLPGIGSDVRKEGVAEVGYDVVPLKAALSLTRLWKTVQHDLGEVNCPVLLYRSARDHVVHRSSSELVLARISSEDKAEVLLPDSYHVATLDNDAPTIFEGSEGFVRRLSRVPGVAEGTQAGARR